MAEGAVQPDPDHHLWRNGRLWWVAFTVHLPGWQKERVRFSLRTHNLTEARRRRDAVLRHYPETRDCELSLRLAARRKPGGSPAEPPRRGLAPRGRETRHAAPGATRVPTPEGSAAMEAGLR